MQRMDNNLTQTLITLRKIELYKKHMVLFYSFENLCLKLVRTLLNNLLRGF